MPRIGAWVADLRYDGDQTIADGDAVTITVGASSLTATDGVLFRGTAHRGGSPVERKSVKVVGGGDRLGTVLLPKQHRGVALRTPLEAILADAGERLSAASEQAVLGVSLQSWARRAGSAGDAVAELLRAAAPSASWRVFADGSLWVGSETWPETGSALPDGSSSSPRGRLLPYNPHDDYAEAAFDLPTLRPGETFTPVNDATGRRVSAVVHVFEPAKVRTRVWFERQESATDRLKSALFGLARHALSAIDYHPSYAATVVQQQGNGDLQVRFDDDRFGGRVGDPKGHAGVKLWPGVPGVSYAIAKGARVLVGFLDGRGRVPIVTGWSSGTPQRVTTEADRIELGAGASRGIARDEDAVDTAVLITTSLLLGPSAFTMQAVVGGVPQGASVVVTLGVDAVQVLSLPGVISSASTKAFAE